MLVEPPTALTCQLLFVERSEQAVVVDLVALDPLGSPGGEDYLGALVTLVLTGAGAERAEALVGLFDRGSADAGVCQLVALGPPTGRVLLVNDDGMVLILSDEGDAP